MATQITKRVGAPSGTITVSLASAQYIVDDGSNATINVASDTDAAALAAHPYLQVSGRSVPDVTPTDISAALAVGRSQSPRAHTVKLYGSSLTIAESHINTVSDRWASKFAGGLGARVEQNYGVNSSKLLETGSPLRGWAHIWQHTADRLPKSAGNVTLDVRPSGAAVVGLQHGVNDGGTYGADANFQTAFAASVEAAIRMFRAGFSWRNTDVVSGGTPGFSYGSGWTNQASSPSYGGTQATHGAGTAVVTFNTTSPFLGGDMTFFALTRPDSNETWSCDVAVDGVTVKTVTSTGKGVNGQRTPVPIFVPNVPSGASHTVTLTFTVAAGGMYFIGGILKSQWPPLSMLFSQPTLPTMPPASEPNLSQSVLNGINSTLWNAAQSYSDGKVRYVDLSPLNGLANLYEDLLHFDIDGHALIADLAVAEVYRAGGVPIGFSEGPMPIYAGKPDWSAPPGSIIYDTTAQKLWVSKSVTAGDWVGVAVA